MKTIGLLLIITAVSYIGVYKTMCAKNRVSTLKTYKNFLLKIKNEVAFMANSIEDIIINASNEFSLTLQLYLIKNPLPLAYETACTEFFSNTDDRQFAINFIKTFGKYDCENQLSYINMSIKELEEKISTQEKAVAEKGRVNIIFYSFLGVAIALVLV